MAAKKKSNLPVWDLSDLYVAIDDPAIQKDLEACKRRAARFNKLYRTKIKKKITSAGLLYDVLAEYESIQQSLAKPVIFASLEFSCAQGDSARGAFLQQMRQKWTEINQDLVFFNIELLEIPSARFKSFIRAKTLAVYANYLTRLQEDKEHMLTEQNEKVFADF